MLASDTYGTFKPTERREGEPHPAAVALTRALGQLAPFDDQNIDPEWLANNLIKSKIRELTEQQARELLLKRRGRGAETVTFEVPRKLPPLPRRRRGRAPRKDVS